MVNDSRGSCSSPWSIYFLCPVYRIFAYPKVMKVVSQLLSRSFCFTFHGLHLKNTQKSKMCFPPSSVSFVTVPAPAFHQNVKEFPFPQVDGEETGKEMYLVFVLHE